MSPNQSLVDRTLSAVWHPCTQMKAHETYPPLPVVAGDGAWLIDADGKRYLDAISSWWVNLFGHCNPKITKAIRTQLEKLDHVILAGFTHEPVVALSERLAARTAHHLGHCFYASDGSSAVEIALKMSMHYWRNMDRPEKNRFITVSGGYHGETVGALAVSDVGLFRDAYAVLLRENVTVSSPDWRLAHNGETPREYAKRVAGEFDQFLQQHAATTAAIIVEPLVQCANTMAMHDAEYLRQLRTICDRHNVHLIADEIAVGFGRTGHFFAHQAANITPDLMTLSKGITGGTLPLSVVMCTDRIYDAFYADEFSRGFLHSHSYTGNALACSAALAVLDIFERQDVINANAESARTILEKVQRLSDHPRVKHIRQTGMITAFDVETNDPSFSHRFHRAALGHGVLLRPIGRTVYFMPPYVLDETEIENMIAGAASALTTALD